MGKRHVCKRHPPHTGEGCFACAEHERGKREGIAEGIRIERARVVAWLYKTVHLPKRDGMAVDLAQFFERGEHVAEGGK